MKGNATVSLLTSHLGSLGSYGKVLTPIFENFAKHWAVLVRFDGDSFFYLCESYTEGNVSGSSGSGNVQQNCKRVTAYEALREKKGVEIHELGRVTLEPHTLSNMCTDVTDRNTNYHLMFNNCQFWVSNLISKMNLSMRSFIAKEVAWMVANFASVVLMIFSLPWRVATYAIRGIIALLSSFKFVKNFGWFSSEEETLLHNLKQLQG